MRAVDPGRLLGLFLRDQIRELIEEDLASEGLTSADIDLAVNFGLAIGVGGALVGAAIWVLHAVYIGRGRTWARVTGSLCLLVQLFGFVSSIAQPAPAISHVASVVGTLLAIGITVLIWLRPSSDYFEASDRARRGY